MLTDFICPDGIEHPVSECLKRCRMDTRCETLPYLHLASDQREWSGEGSTTQLLNGTMLSFLLLTQPYSEDPDSLAFRIHGTRGHSNLEQKAKDIGLPSELSCTEDGRNAIDLLIPHSWRCTCGYEEGE